MTQSRLPAYAELHALTNFSFLRGASHPEELMAHARQLGYHALAVTDECSLAGVVRAHTAAGEAEPKFIVGSEISLLDGPEIVLLAMDREGYGELSALITRGRRRARKGEYELIRADLEAGVPGCLALLIPRRKRLDTENFSARLSHARWLKDLFPSGAWIAAELFLEAGDREYLQMLRRLAKGSGLSLVAAGDVHMHCRKRHMLQDALAAVRLGTTVEAAGLRLHSNGERHLRSRQALAR
ncbi:MAG: PHP domain-containing protein, partial [Phycisphaerae bacterium]